MGDLVNTYHETRIPLVERSGQPGKVGGF